METSGTKPAIKSFADVEAGKIILRTPFSQLLLCRRIPGGWWDAPRKAWTYPATPHHAAIVRRTIPQLATSSSFDALTAKKAAPQSKHAPTTAPDLPAGLKTRPWRHQIAAYEFAMERFLQGLTGVMLAMGMGTGKSLVACMILLGLRAMRTLIVAPLRVVQVWIAQLERHVTTPMVVAALDEDAGSVADKQRLAEEKLRLAETTGVPFVAVINYDSVWREPFGAWAERQAWDLVVADESHKLKRPGGKASLYFKRLRSRARHRLALTGTPMPHSPLDVYAQFRFLDASVFGPSFNAFKQKYAVMGGFQNKQVTNLQEPRRTGIAHAAGHVPRRQGRARPAARDPRHLPHDALPECQAIYRAIEEDFIAEVEGGTITVANAMVALLRLQQIAGGWVKTDDERYRRVDWAKQRLLEDTLEDVGPGEPVVVFCRFHAISMQCTRHAKRSGLHQPGALRPACGTRALATGEAQVLAVQISSGGVGVDLSRARYAIYYSLSFSLGEYDQALSRVHRPGQTRPVEHIHLVARQAPSTRRSCARLKSAPKSSRRSSPRSKGNRHEHGATQGIRRARKAQARSGFGTESHRRPARRPRTGPCAAVPGRRRRLDEGRRPHRLHRPGHLRQSAQRPRRGDRRPQAPELGQYVSENYNTQSLAPSCAKWPKKSACVASSRSGCSPRRKCARRCRRPSATP
jgi:superfamily II DNA or RNA helicase